MKFWHHFLSFTRNLQDDDHIRQGGLVYTGVGVGANAHFTQDMDSGLKPGTGIYSKNEYT